MNKQKNRTSGFDAYDVTLDMIRALRELKARIREHDKNLSIQLCDAASSAALNLREGNRRLGKDRRYLFSVAAGSADEARGCLEVAEAWGYIDEDAAAEALDLLDRIGAMTYRLTH